ncbi:MAG TPA: GNAT family N-acetyltransferase [Anaerolineales bacterium]|nr:GNAT family N-acetyltransferase [Anaerolineales bacterium]
MFIGKVSELTGEIYEVVCRLVPQLGAHKVIPTQDDLTALLNSEASTLLVARYPDEESKIVGILTISIYQVPTGVRSIVEDVIVDSSVRRRGIAKALMKAAIEIARDAGANGVALTSNFQRVEANLMYQNMGFAKRETNTYFYKLK